jgi:hypothetical protein
MENYLLKCKTALQLFAVFSLFIGALLFASPAGAVSREVNPLSAVPAKVAPVELAYWHRGYHRNWNHRYHRYHRNWNYRYHRYHGYRHYYY